MASMSCPHGDNGVCTVPQRTAVITQGGVEVRSRGAVEEEFPQFDVSEARLVPVPTDDDADMEGLLRSESAGATRAAEGALIEALEREAMTTGLVVHCSCGHTFIAEVPTAGATAASTA